MLQQYDINSTEMSCDTSSALNTPFSVKDILNMNIETNSEYYNNNIKKEFYSSHQQFWENSHFCGSPDYGFYYNNDNNDSCVNKSYWSGDTHSDLMSPQIQQLQNMYGCHQNDIQHRVMVKVEEEYVKVESPSK